ncbi:hypothetical protein [Nocardia sp. NPDC052566]|uniref:hypothetical protein n=1 Tax=Nocardia sp. NPDC052566 TaxID=3364330 RepID=UPI0037CCA333
MQLFRCTVAVSALALTAGCTASQAAPVQTAATTVMNCLSEPHVRPAHLAITCADANHFVTDITWEHWDADGARGTGIDDKNLCVPHCVGGRRQQEPIDLELSNPRAGVFTVVTIKLSGSRKQQSYSLPA